MQYPGFNRSVSKKTYNSANKQYRQWKKDINAETAPESLAKYYDMRYNNTKEYELLDGYAKGIQKDEISPLVGFDFYKKTANDIESSLLNITTSDNVRITDYHPHFVNRIIGQVEEPHEGMRQGTPIKYVKEALLYGEPGKDHYRTVTQGNVTFKDKRRTYKGKNAKVTVSITENKLIQANPRNNQRKEHK